MRVFRWNKSRSCVNKQGRPSFMAPMRVRQMLDGKHATMDDVRSKEMTTALELNKFHHRCVGTSMILLVPSLEPMSHAPLCPYLNPSLKLLPDSFL